MLNTQQGGSRYTKIRVYLAWKQIHSKYTAKYTVSGGGAGGWQTRESHAQMVKSQSEIPKSKKLNYLSSSDRLPRSNVGQSCEKSMKTHEIRQIFLRLRRAGRI